MTIFEWHKIHFKVAAWLSGYCALWDLITWCIITCIIMEKMSAVLRVDCQLCTKLLYINALFFLPGIQAIWTVCGLIFIMIRWQKFLVENPILFVCAVVFCIVFQFILYTIVIVVTIILLVEKFKESRRRENTGTHVNNPNERSQAILLSDPLFNPYEKKDSKLKSFVKTHLFEIVNKPFNKIDNHSLMTKFTEIVDEELFNKLKNPALYSHQIHHLGPGEQFIRCSRHSESEIDTQKKKGSFSRRNSRSRNNSRGNSTDKASKKESLNIDEHIIDHVEQIVDYEILCSICYENFNVNDMITTLPGCKHKFHYNCISNWFTTRPTCPMCRGYTKKRMLEHYHGDFSKSNSVVDKGSRVSISSGNNMINLAQMPTNSTENYRNIRGSNTLGVRVRGIMENYQNNDDNSA